MRGTPSENRAVLGVIDPQSAAAAKSTGWVHVGPYEWLSFIGLIGATDHDIDGKFEMADNSDGDNPVDVTGKAITQIGNATADNKQVVVDLHRDNDLKATKPYARFTITPSGGSAALLAGVLEGFNARHRPVSHAATVVEAITGAGLTDPQSP